MADITPGEIDQLTGEFRPLVGLRLDWLALPEASLPGFEPSQIAVIVNTLIDAALPQIELLALNPENKERLLNVGLSKAPGPIGQREGYPDFIHKSGYRVELKGLFVDNLDLKLKRPPTRREASARLKENIRIEDVVPDRDVLMLAAVQLQDFDTVCHPVIIDIGIFSMIECIRVRDSRLLAGGRRWNGGVPQVVKKSSYERYRAGQALSNADFEKDTNFGKLKRVPYPPLQTFMQKHGVLAAVDMGDLAELVDDDEASEE